MQITSKCKNLLISAPLAFLALITSAQKIPPPQISASNTPKLESSQKEEFIKDTSPPDFLISIDLAKFKVRLFRNGQQIDSGLVGSGKYYSPILEIKQNYLIERPSFHPTPNEKKAGKFTHAVPPCRMDWFSVGSTNPQGRGKIPLIGFFGIHGTNRPELLPGNVSSGCCRMDNLFNDRLHFTLKTQLPVRKKTKGLTKYYYFEKPFTVRLSYSLWELQSITDSTISLLAWQDVHHHLAEPPRKHAIMPNDSVKGNGYRLWHLLRDVEEKGWKLKDGLQENSAQVQQFWNLFRKQLESVRGQAKPLLIKQSIFQKK